MSELPYQNDFLLMNLSTKKIVCVFHAEWPHLTVSDLSFFQLMRLENRLELLLLQFVLVAPCPVSGEH